MFHVYLPLVLFRKYCKSPAETNKISKISSRNSRQGNIAQTAEIHYLDIVLLSVRGGGCNLQSLSVYCKPRMKLWVWWWISLVFSVDLQVMNILFWTKGIAKPCRWQLTTCLILAVAVLFWKLLEVELLIWCPAKSPLQYGSHRGKRGILAL